MKRGRLKRKQGSARMAKLADAADLKSADLYRSWGFKSPSGHHKTNNLQDIFQNSKVREIRTGATFGATLKFSGLLVEVKAINSVRE
jgi:hypothetical protein